MARKLHLIFSLIAGVFILLGALTGAILAGETFYNKTLPYKSAEFESTTLAQTVVALKEKKIDALKLTVDRNGFVKVETAEGKTIFIHPKSGEVMQGKYKTPKFFQVVKTLHRSLYMGKTGRVIMGITALCFFVVALSGLWLIVRKQKFWHRFFHKLPKENFYNHYHTSLGRWALLPIAIVCLTGVYMGLETIGVFPRFKPKHKYDVSTLKETPIKPLKDFIAFQVPLSEVRRVDFPAFEDVEEVYKVDFIDKNVVVNQFTGEVISTSTSPYKSLMYLVRTLHVGKGNVLWSSVLLLTCLAILFFIYSGFVITLRKCRKHTNNPFDKDECEYILLVGSEGGTTRKFACLLHNELLRVGKRSYLTDMNAYTSFAQMQQLVIFTCTYGDGEAPISAVRFVELYQKTLPTQTFQYAVVGFGSTLYPDFCKYAKEVDTLLAQTPQAEVSTPLHTIDQQDFESFKEWAKAWATTQNLHLQLPANFSAQPQRKAVTFSIVAKTPVMDDAIFLVRLRPLKKVRFTSGDLLGITPTDQRERLYSVVRLDNDILLSVKLHLQGVVSNMLNDLPIGEEIQGNLVENKHFHFPKKAPQVVCIANGSGMAPFLGMIAQNTKKRPITLIWGCRREAALEIYRPYIERFTKEGKLKTYWQALSQEGEKFYVQDILKREALFFANLLKNKGVVMICGSIAMQKAVMEVLEAICREHLNKPLSYYQNKGQIRSDCY
ncbi:hypothetical protein RCZ04_03080 [Capnocytophaga sp. HP1101]